MCKKKSAKFFIILANQCLNTLKWPKMASIFKNFLTQGRGIPLPETLPLASWPQIQITSLYSTSVYYL